jgi:hypothetical protein
MLVFTSIALTASSVSVWRWYQHRPKPELASFSISAPGRTRIEVEGAKPDPLIVRFDRSAATLAFAGREVPKGITLCIFCRAISRRAHAPSSRAS